MPFEAARTQLRKARKPETTLSSRTRPGTQTKLMSHMSWFCNAKVSLRVENCPYDKVNSFSHVLILNSLQLLHFCVIIDPPLSWSLHNSHWSTSSHDPPHFAKLFLSHYHSCTCYISLDRPWKLFMICLCSCLCKKFTYHPANSLNATPFQGTCINCSAHARSFDGLHVWFGVLIALRWMGLFVWA